MNKRLGVMAVFLAGCAVGGVSSQLVVPKASAQQAATLTKWEYYLLESEGDDGDVRRAANRLGAEGWEMTGHMAYRGGVYSWFKRPKL